MSSKMKTMKKEVVLKTSCMDGGCGVECEVMFPSFESKKEYGMEVIVRASRDCGFVVEKYKPIQGERDREVETLGSVALDLYVLSDSQRLNKVNFCLLFDIFY
jgi:hypothetical protein